jgi:hypothetical protein
LRAAARHPKGFRIVRSLLLVSSVSLLIASAGCAGGNASTNPVPVRPDSAVRQTQAKGVPGGGGGGGGTAVTIPPAMTIDGPSQFMYSPGLIGTPISANVDFDRQQNQIPGGTVQGTTRIATEIIFNNSKKTALTITSATIGGPNAGDFTVSAIPTAPLAPNKDAAFEFVVTFTPSGDGVRTATLSITSNAGTATGTLSGTGLVNRPVVTQFAPLSFFPTSAPAILEMANGGGQSLQISSVSIVGANANAFVLLPLSGAGLGTCQFVGGGPSLLGPHQFCDFEVGVAPGAPAPASASLVIVSNDPVTPVETVPLTLSPL